MWIEYTPAGKTSKGDSAISICRKSGSIRILQRAVTDCRLDKFEYCTLHYDPDRKLVGIKPSNIQHANSVKMAQRKCNVQFHAKDYLEVAEVPAGRYAAKWDESSNMLVARLS